MLKVSAFYLEKKNITKGNIFSAIVNIKTKKLWFTDPIFSEGFAFFKSQKSTLAMVGMESLF